MLITNEQYALWNNAIINASLGSNQTLKEFAQLYPDLYRYLTAMLRKRTKIKMTLSAMSTITDKIYWGALTFNEEETDKLESTKRKQVLRFLDKYFKVFCFVEEYGEENDRYHIHFFGVMRKPTDYECMRQDWHSFLFIELLKPYEYKRKAKYLTKYAVKSVPRVRMSKRCIELVKDYRKLKSFRQSHFDFYDETYWRNAIDVVDTPF